MAEERRRRGSRRERAQNVEARREVATVRCPFCHSDVPQDALAAKCAKCQTVHHATCFDEKSGCSVDGCGGKGAQVVKGWRASLGECRACRAKVYLDENVVICASCESFHHPSCLEARDGCAECGSGEGMLVLASTVQKLGPSRWGLLPLAPLLLAGAACPLLWSLGHARFMGLGICIAGGLVPLFWQLGRKLDARHRRRMLENAAEKVASVKPAAPKADG